MYLQQVLGAPGQRVVLGLGQGELEVDASLFRGGVTEKLGGDPAPVTHFHVVVGPDDGGLDETGGVLGPVHVAVDDTGGHEGNT